jgi:hypothetical protein
MLGGIMDDKKLYAAIAYSDENGHRIRRKAAI